MMQQAVFNLNITQSQKFKATEFHENYQGHLNVTELSNFLLSINLSIQNCKTKKVTFWCQN